MIKKIISLLCLVSIIVILVPGNYAYAESTVTSSEKEAVLQVLGINDAKTYGTATNDYFLAALSGFLYGEGEKLSPEEFGKMIGIFNSGDVYDGNKTISSEDALLYALATLGYKAYTESLGADGIKKVSSSLELSKGLSQVNDQPITVDECIVILYNMLEIEPTLKMVMSK